MNSWCQSTSEVGAAKRHERGTGLCWPSLRKSIIFHVAKKHERKSLAASTERPGDKSVEQDRRLGGCDAAMI